ncbi:MAG: hypothetical protein ACH0QD_04595 [Tepidibacillus sp.]
MTNIQFNSPADLQAGLTIHLEENTLMALTFLSFLGIMKKRQLARFFNPNKVNQQIKNLIRHELITKEGYENHIIYKLAPIGIKRIKKVPLLLQKKDYIKSIVIAELITRLNEITPVTPIGKKGNYRIIKVSNIELYIAYEKQNIDFYKGKKHILVGRTLYDLKQHTFTNEFVRFALEEEIFSLNTDRLFYRYDNEWIKEVNKMFSKSIQERNHDI